MNIPHDPKTAQYGEYTKQDYQVIPPLDGDQF